MKELIADLEALTGPCRKIDERIAIEIAAVHPKHGKPVAVIDPPHFSASIDVAMTLLPSNCQWTLEQDSAWVRWMDKDDVEEAQGVLCGRDGKCTAIALCIASLKARARMKEHCDPATMSKRGKAGNVKRWNALRARAALESTK